MIKKSTRRIAIIAHKSKTPSAMPTRRHVFCFDVKLLKETNYCRSHKHRLAHLYHCLIPLEDFFVSGTLLRLGSLSETLGKEGAVVGFFITSFLFIDGKCFITSGFDG